MESRSRNDNEVGVPVVHHAMPKVAKRRPRHEQLLLSYSYCRIVTHPGVLIQQLAARDAS